MTNQGSGSAAPRPDLLPTFRTCTHWSFPIMTTDWRENCARQDHHGPAAIKHIRPGDRVFVGSACGEPQELVRALVDTAGGPEDTEVLERADHGRRPLHRPEVLRSLPCQRVLHRQQRARRGGPGPGGLHADLLLADPRDVPLGPPADRRRPDHGQPAGPVRVLQPRRVGRHDAVRRAVRQTAGRPGQPLHAAHARQQLHSRARHRLTSCRTTSRCSPGPSSTTPTKRHARSPATWPAWSRTATPCNWASAGCPTRCWPN